MKSGLRIASFMNFKLVKGVYQRRLTFNTSQTTALELLHKSNDIFPDFSFKPIQKSYKPKLNNNKPVRRDEVPMQLLKE